MSKNKNERERILLLNRLFERKDMILQASTEIEDLRVQYIENGRKDSNGKIEAEVVKRLLTIFSCLSELGVSRIFLSLVTNMPYIGLRRDRARGATKQEEEDLHVAELPSTTLICAIANTVVINWREKKEPIINIGHIESLIKAHFSPSP